VSSSKSKAGFIEPMLLLQTDRLPEGPNQSYELKLDGYRAPAIKTGGRVKLRSRNDNDFNGRYSAIVNALSTMPDETVIDGEVVALDESGRPSFNLLQNHGSAGAPLIYYVFDVLVLNGRDVMSEPLVRRREILRHEVLAQLGEPIRESPVLNASLRDLITAVRAQGLEGLVAKRLERVDTNLASGPAHGKRCSSTKVKNLLSAGTPRARRTLTPSFLGTTKVLISCMRRGRETASRRHQGSNCSGSFEGWRCPSARL
jgi:bifunctional non-homologous end joining protein LigD